MARTQGPYPAVVEWTRRCAPDESTPSGGAAAQATTLTLGQTAPDAEALVVAQRVLEALGLDLAAGADLLGLAGRAALLREERLGVGLGAQRPLLPRLGVGLQTDAQHARDALVAQVLTAQLPGGAVAGAQAEPVSRPLGRAHVIAQPRHLRHDDASPFALVPVRVPRDFPGSLHSMT